MSSIRRWFILPMPIKMMEFYIWKRSRMYLIDLNLSWWHLDQIMESARLNLLCAVDKLDLDHCYRQVKCPLILLPRADKKVVYTWVAGTRPPVPSETTWKISLKVYFCKLYFPFFSINSHLKIQRLPFLKMTLTSNSVKIIILFSFLTFNFSVFFVG